MDHERILVYIYSMKTKQSITLWASDDSKFLPLCMSTNDQESTTSVDLGVTNKFQWGGEFANKESNNEGQLYFGFVTFYFSPLD